MLQFYCKPQVNAALFSLPTVATPAFAPGAGTYTSIQTVTISCSTPASNIFYTVDGSTPTTSSTHYTAPISVSSSQTVQAIATASGFIQSNIGSAVYVINLATTATPTFSPVAGTYGPPQNVTITCSTPSSSIFYTIDGSTPTPSSTPYVGPISVATAQTVQAIATATGLLNSAIGSASYVITTLVFTPAPLPNYTDGIAYSQLVTFSNGTGPFTLLAGPPWMTITAQNSSTSCTVGGTPTGSGTITVTFQSTT